MARRSNQQQSRHDAEVARIAEYYKKQGYKVKADVKGYAQPDTIGGYRPDVVAKQGSTRRIVEVETKQSAEGARDRKQQAAFRRSASRSKATTFRRKVV